jgi:hypothetical protein
MANSEIKEVKKYKFTQLNVDDQTGEEYLLELHPESDADIINVTKGTNAYPGTASNVQDALEEVYGLAKEGGVTGVKGAAEGTYRTGQVNLTPENIGAQKAFTDGGATIASESNGIVTIKTGVSQDKGKIGNSTDSDITLGAAAKKGVATSISSSSTNNDLATAKAVNDAIIALPSPMVFKGSLGTGGTITELPTASAANEGYTYKVITAGTYAGQAAGVGDMFICGKPDGSSSYAWILIPAGDEPEGTVTSVGLSMPTGFSVENTPITSSGTLTVKFASGYSLPTTAKQSAWDGKQAQIAKTGSATKPVYFSAAGTVAEASTYAGGTKVTLNGADKGASEASFYAPAGAGTSGQILKSSGTGAPTWVNQSTLSVGSATTAGGFASAKTVALTGDVTGSASGGASGGWSITTTLANSGVTAGTYSAVTVNAKGLVTAGAQFIEVGAAGQSAPSANLAVGGIFFKQI